MISLYLGGARSGKSGLAEDYLAELDNGSHDIHYIATARQHPSMAQRIALHQQRRPAHWHCHECPLALIELLQQLDQPQALIIVDCLTLWLTNLMMASADLAAATEQLTQQLQQSRAEVILVSTEVGQGLIPDDPMSQAFVAASGELHQAIAAVADQVCFCQAGMPLQLKGGKR
ncbi:bifunctional adenosylcobinamide kinase/adenosylcobinamide-phosphate guanylyltransferase [Ferrimonas lipolytica]|uniref:Bifunctional adenosylcobalamin biosynthesis protein n=1 Tax=Ferrimonas lipolytica TaxID=2724191 RepID=A0A6H1UB13_9GAMM|nr:bifunctional adenosylcobinamide kinase/adenosylcobinamide-phosphate guanylyltransferase [Ferrimonas lipolytica]QIZ76267.1 bifunctional adenosylcobinamide kinase/adenosylcobinamide-phosphate guanylyltransferase [Ferrimonas lipolytica]